MRFVVNNLTRQPTVKELLYKHFPKKAINFSDFRDRNCFNMTKQDKEFLFKTYVFGRKTGMRLWRKREREEFINTYLDILKCNKYVPITLFNSSQSDTDCEIKAIILRTLNRNFIEELSQIYEVPFIKRNYYHYTLNNYAELCNYRNGKFLELFKDVINNKDNYRLVFSHMRDQRDSRSEGECFVVPTDDKLKFCSKDIIDAGGCPIGISEITVVNKKVILK